MRIITPLLLITLMFTLVACGRSEISMQEPAATETPGLITTATGSPEPHPSIEAKRPKLNERFMLDESERIAVEVVDSMGAPAVLELRFKGVMLSPSCFNGAECQNIADAPVIFDARLGNLTPEAIEMHFKPKDEDPPPIVFGLYNVHLIALTPLEAQAANSATSAHYRAELMLTLEAPPAATAPPPPNGSIMIDACSLVETSHIVERFGPLTSEPQRAVTTMGDGQQCSFNTQSGTVMIAWYRSHDIFAHDLIVELTADGGAVLTAIDSRPGSSATLVEGQTVTSLVRIFGDRVIHTALRFSAPVQPHERSTIQSSLDMLQHIAMIRYAAGLTTTLPRAAQ